MRFNYGFVSIKMSLSLGNTSGAKSHDFTPTIAAPAPATYQIAKMAKIACPSQRHPGGPGTAARLPRSRRSDGKTHDRRGKPRLLDLAL